MHIFITGATGFIGSTLSRALLKEGHTITAYVRNKTRAAAILGTDVALVTDIESIKADLRVDAIINLAGTPIADRLWTKSYRKKCLESRVGTTRKLVGLVARLREKPSVMISVSAAGYYGATGSDPVSEEAPPQGIFMSELCARWEEAAREVMGYGVRLVIPRFGVVLGSDGGAFPKMLTPARFGLGARFGSGEQYFPWIHKADLIRLLMFCLKNENVEGPVNAVAPETVRQKEFNQTLAASLHRPALLVIPSFLLKLLPGGMEHLFLSGQNMSSSKIEQSGFIYRYPGLSPALVSLLG